MTEKKDTPTPRPKETLPEAPASINFKVVDKDGFNYQITLRDLSENALMGRVKAIRSWLVENSFVPPGKQPAGNGSQNTLPDEDPGWCQLHNVGMKQRKNDTGEWYSHKYGDGWCNGKEA